MRVGAERTDRYFPLLRGKKLAVVVNHTSCVGKRHLVDVLLSAGMGVERIFTPEHGFWGTADAGAAVAEARYRNIPVHSLHGAQKKMNPEQLEDTDCVLFDMQDVGVRFYTYLTTMHHVMEACARARRPLLVLDRPNPNGDYVAGPVLDLSLRSFVGWHPIPIVHGMTLGELALMIKGEGWLHAKESLTLSVVKVAGWQHRMLYDPPIPPSPNLRTHRAIRWYPTLCLFEGTVMSVGRGTHIPFEAVGHPDPAYGTYVFTPEAREGALHPRYEGQRCYGRFYGQREPLKEVLLDELLYFYERSVAKERFFTPYFEKLCGSARLRNQLIEGVPQDAIQAGWRAAQQKFLSQRARYLLYDDFDK